MKQTNLTNSRARYSDNMLRNAMFISTLLFSFKCMNHGITYMFILHNV